MSTNLLDILRSLQEAAKKTKTPKDSAYVDKELTKIIGTGEKTKTVKTPKTKNPTKNPKTKEPVIKDEDPAAPIDDIEEKPVVEPEPPVSSADPAAPELASNMTSSDSTMQGDGLETPEMTEEEVKENTANVYKLYKIYSKVRALKNLVEDIYDDELNEIKFIIDESIVLFDDYIVPNYSMYIESVNEIVDLYIKLVEACVNKVESVLDRREKEDTTTTTKKKPVGKKPDKKESQNKIKEY